MIKEKHKKLAAQFEEKLRLHNKLTRSLVGLGSEANIQCFVAQLIDSWRRVQFAVHLRENKVSKLKCTPWSGCFDPLSAAVFHNREGRTDEAWWLVFLATHFGKHTKDKWALTEAVYGRLGQSEMIWTWASVSSDPKIFLAWIEQHAAAFKLVGRFSNHRKYESLTANSKNGVSAVLGSYIDWVVAHGGPKQLVGNTHKVVGQDPRVLFDALYIDMNKVSRFGRLGKFDFLTMLGKLHIAPVDPGSAYLNEATGPRDGARLLFLGDANDKSQDRKLDSWLLELEGTLGTGMQILEDAMCNWQKSPEAYKYFRG